MKVSVNPPKTPVTKGSQGMATATMPNVCKMPGPPAPFVPTPLPNIAKSSDNLADASKDVKIEGKIIGIKGCTFKSMGDMPSKGTGGGLVSATTHGVAKFVAPGSMNVKAEGKNIHFLGDATTNNNSNPANAATIAELQAAGDMDTIMEVLDKIAEECNDAINEQHEKDGGSSPPSGKECTGLGTKKHKCCENAIKEADNPKVKSEVGYDKAGKLMDQRAMDAAKSAADTAYNNAKSAAQASAAAAGMGAAATAAHVSAAVAGVWSGAFFGGGGAPHLKADVVILKDGAASAAKSNVSRAVDFKFNCGKKGKMDADQRQKYKDTIGKVPKIIHKSW
jgi:hypothetical protein